MLNCWPKDEVRRSRHSRELIYRIFGSQGHCKSILETCILVWVPKKFHCVKKSIGLIASKIYFCTSISTALKMVKNTLKICHCILTHLFEFGRNFYCLLHIATTTIWLLSILKQGSFLVSYIWLFICCKIKLKKIIFFKKRYLFFLNIYCLQKKNFVYEKKYAKKTFLLKKTSAKNVSFDKYIILQKMYIYTYYSTANKGWLMVNYCQS